MQEENEYVQDEAVVQEEVTATEESEESNDDTVTLSKSEYSKLKRQAIAYKANKVEKPVVQEERNTTNSLSEEDIEAKILRSQGKSAEQIEEMRALAKVRGKSLLEVQNDPILVAMEQVRERESLDKKARLGASRGSATVKPTKSTATPGLSEAEFKELWKEANNK